MMCVMLCVLPLTSCVSCSTGVEGEVIVQKLLGQPFEIGYNAMIDVVEVRKQSGKGLADTLIGRIASWLPLRQHKAS